MDRQIRTVSDAPRKGRVLLIDDEPSVLHAYGRILWRAGFTVEQLSEGAAVPAVLAAREFDVVISDIRLPDANGIEILRAAHTHDPDLPVVLMTGGAELGSAIEAIENGALRYLLKPVDSALLVKTAQHAARLRQVAQAKRRAFELYGADESKQLENARLTTQFDHALATLHLEFQPIVRWSTGQIFAYEALARSREASMTRPGELFTAAARLKRLHEVGRAVRLKAASLIHAAGFRPQVLVNLHPLDFNDPELTSPSAPLSQVASQVVFEVTERAPLDGLDIKPKLAALRQLGFRFALDDLGAGYAGLSSFAQLEPEIVKLDMSLIRGIDTESTKRKLVETMATLCGELDMLVIAEGVETPGECRSVVASGCDYLQGFLFAKPAAPWPAAHFGRSAEVRLSGGAQFASS